MIKNDKKTIGDEFGGKGVTNKSGCLGDKKITLLKGVFITLIVLGIIGLAAGGVGLAHQFGAFSHLSQVHALIMMGAGGGGGILFLIVGIVGTVKSCRKSAELSKIENNSQISFKCSSATCEISALYDYGEGEGIVDLAYCDANLGYGCVVDGTGHNNPKMKEPLTRRFDAFFEKYKKGLGDQASKEAISLYFKQNIEELERQFKDHSLLDNQIEIYPEERKKTIVEAKKNQGYDFLGTFLDSTYHPAMSFVQVIREKNVVTLLTAQAADTIVFAEMEDGEVRKITGGEQGMGVGSGVKIQAHDITGAKRVIGFSDGIGEFMTLGELKKIVNEITSENLFDALVEQASKPRTEATTERGANGSSLHKFNPKDTKNGVDDVGLFVLDL